MQKFSYHTHTNFSDGRNSLEEMLERAVELGWDEIGISDHMIIHKNIKKTPGYNLLAERDSKEVYKDSFKNSLDCFRKHSECVRKAAKNFPIKVFIGYEVDYFTYDGWEDEFKEFIKQIDHDYLLNGNHFFIDEKSDGVIDIYRYDLLNLGEGFDSFEAYLKRHYETIKKSVESGLFDILAHLDYARRTLNHKFFPCVKERLDIVKSLKKSKMAVEVSTKGLRKVDSFYPEDFIIKELINNNIPIVIHDDAHKVSELGYEFEKAEEKLKELNCLNRFSLK